MAVKRLITDKERKKLKDLKKYKKRIMSSLSQEEKDDLLRIVAEKLNLI